MSSWVVTQRLETNRHGDRIDVLEQAYARYFAEFLGPLVPLPNLDSAIGHVEQCEGLLLSGGSELPSALVDGQHLEPSAEELIAERYRVQRQFLECALEREKPVIAICYGWYLVNDHFGGRLTGNVHRGEARRRPGLPHEIRVEPRLIPGCETERTSVNSYHHQGIVRGQLATELEVVCCDEPFDIVEAARHGSRPILCMQWHPERPSPDEHFNRTIIESFLSETS